MRTVTKTDSLEILASDRGGNFQVSLARAGGSVVVRLFAESVRDSNDLDPDEAKDLASALNRIADLAEKKRRW